MLKCILLEHNLRPSFCCWWSTKSVKLVWRLLNYCNVSLWTNNLIKLKVLGPIWKIGRNTIKVPTGLAWASLVSLHICRVSVEPSSMFIKNHKIYAYWLYNFFISLHLFYLWWHWAHKPSVTLQFMTLPSNWRFNPQFDWQIRHSCGAWQWQVLFFYCDCLIWGKSACLPTAAAKLSKSHEITSKNDYYSLSLCREGSGCPVHLHMLTRVFITVPKYHMLAQMTICLPFIRTVNAVVRLHQQAWHI